jgi:hypothetical protein
MSRPQLYLGDKSTQGVATPPEIDENKKEMSEPT